MDDLPIRPFALERFYARWEFEVEHNLSASDVEAPSLHELLALADDETARLWRGLRLGYTESAGHPLLRQEIARLYDRATPADILTFAGAQEGILLALGGLLRAGDHVVALAPAYQSLHEVAAARGAEVTRVWLREEEGWRLDVDRVLEAVRSETRFVVVNFPHSPTGALPPAADFRRLAEACGDRGIRLFSDEVYRGVELEPDRRLPAGSDLHDGHLSLGVLSKAYALPGLRIGWIACRDPEVIRTLAALKDYTTICSSAPSEILALIALRAGDRLLERSRAIIRGNRSLLEAFVADHAGAIRWVPPEGGTTTFPAFPGRDTAAFCERLAAEDGLLLLPGSLFDMPGEHARIGLGRHGMERGLGILGQRLSG